MNGIRRQLNRLRRTSVIAACGLTIATVLGCGSNDSADSATDSSGARALEKYREDGITMAIQNLPPYSVVRGDGVPAGYGPALAAAVLTKMGITDIEVRATQFNAMIPGLEAGQWDLIAGDINQTSERCKLVLFADPDLVTQSAFLIAAGNPLNITGPADIEPNNLTVAVGPGTSEEEYLVASGVDKSHFEYGPDPQSEAKALENGRADIMFGGSVDLPALAPDGFEVVVDEGGPLRGASVAFRMEDRKLRDAYNEALRELKKDGTLPEIAAENFIEGSGFEKFDAQLTASTTSQDLKPPMPECQ